MIDEIIQSLRLVQLSKLRRELEKAQEKNPEFLLKLKVFFKRCERKPE